MSRGTVVHISTTDGTGGAARAARRVHDGLTAEGWESWIASGIAPIGGERVTTLAKATAAHTPKPLNSLEPFAPYVRGAFGERRMPIPSSRRFTKTELFRRASVINLHNLHGGYFDYKALPRWAASVPIVATLHDMWSFTGHCAYSFGCERWEDGCHHCPMWRENKGLDEIPRTFRDNSRSEWRRKRSVYRRTPISVVAPTRWLADMAQRSILAPDAVHHVPYPLDTAAYAAMDQDSARELLGLPAGRPMALFGAAQLHNERKGMRLLTEAVERARRERPELELLAMGPTGGLLGELRGAHAVGEVTDPRLQRAVYSAADVLVLPSLADNQPLSMLEAMACSRPVVAFDAGGIPETVRHMETGWVAPAGDAEALAAGLVALLGDDELRARLGAASRQHIERENDLRGQARRYGEVYAEAIERHAGRS
jgi:glycosyltransferase involved in cell wall biosynthesis